MEKLGDSGSSCVARNLLRQQVLVVAPCKLLLIEMVRLVQIARSVEGTSFHDVLPLSHMSAYGL